VDKVTYTDEGLRSAQIYQYAVRAYKKEKNTVVLSSFTEVKTCTRPATAQLAVKALKSGVVKLSWKDVSREDGYAIYRQEHGGVWKLIAKVGEDKTSHTDKTVSAGIKYRYRVQPYRIVDKAYVKARVKSSAYVEAKEASNTGLSSAQKDVMKKILYAVETGGQVYGNQDYSDFTEAYANSYTEVAITIGAGQWYATEAQRLLKLIRSTDEETFNKLDTAGIGKDLDSANWSTYKVSKTSKKAKCIQKIISSKVGIQCQDKLMIIQVEEYAAEAMKLGVTDPKAIGMCINLRHLGGYGGMTRILGKTSKPYTMEKMWKAMQSDTGTQVGASMYRTRHEKVMKWLNTYM
jgi:hypothetical protein